MDKFLEKKLHEAVDQLILKTIEITKELNLDEEDTLINFTKNLLINFIGNFTVLYTKESHIKYLVRNSDEIIHGLRNYFDLRINDLCNESKKQESNS